MLLCLYNISSIATEGYTMNINIKNKNTSTGSIYIYDSVTGVGKVIFF